MSFRSNFKSIKRSGAQPLTHASDLAPQAMSSNLQGSPQIWKFGSGELVAALIATPLLTNFKTQREHHGLDNMA